MRDKQTLTQIVDVIENGADSFERLRKVVVLRNRAGEVMASAHSHHIRIAVTIDGKPHTLYIPFGMSDEQRVEFVSRVRATRGDGLQVLAVADFLPHELRLVDRDGYRSSLDVVVEEGSGSLLGEVMDAVRLGRREKVREWIGCIGYFDESLVESELCHALPSAENMRLDSRGRLRLCAYPFYPSDSCSDCYKTLLSTGLALYLVGSSPVLMTAYCPNLTLRPAQLLAIAEALDARVPVQRRLEEVINSLLGGEMDSYALFSHLHILSILPFEAQISPILEGVMGESAQTIVEQILVGR